jgi:hypothetical protein
MERSVNLAEPEDIDKLVMFTHAGSVIYLAICPDDNKTISLVEGGRQILLTQDEANLLAASLKECTKDMI